MCVCLFLYWYWGILFSDRWVDSWLHSTKVSLHIVPTNWSFLANYLGGRSHYTHPFAVQNQTGHIRDYLHQCVHVFKSKNQKRKQSYCYWNVNSMTVSVYLIGLSPTPLTINHVTKQAKWILMLYLESVCFQAHLEHKNVHRDGRWVSNFHTSKMTSVLERQRPLQKLTSTLSRWQRPLVMFWNWT